MSENTTDFNDVSMLPSIDFSTRINYSILMAISNGEHNINYDREIFIAARRIYENTFGGNDTIHIGNFDVAFRSLKPCFNNDKGTLSLSDNGKNRLVEIVLKQTRAMESTVVRNLKLLGENPREIG